MKNVLIINATIIDGTGKKPLENRDILVEKNIIKDIIPSNSLNNPEVEIIDAQGSFILPGFIDTHIHLMANGFRMEDNMQKPLALHFYNALKNMEKTLNAGVTTVRDAGLADAGVKMASEKNLFPAPRMQISVMPLSISGGHFDFFLKSGFDMKLSYPGLPESICDGEAEVRKRTREILRSGAEVIKVMATGGVISANDSPEFSQFTLKELQSVVEEANYKGGLKVMAHAHGTEGIKNSLKAGIHSIEHGTYIDQEAADMMVENNAYLVPTFVVTNLNKKKALQGELPEYSRKEAIEISHVHQENMGLAYHSGVQIVMGTDCGVVEHGNNLLELEYLCKMGMEPMEALMAGTLKAAECMGWEEKIGSIEKGKLADMVMVKKNPLDDISSLSDEENILMVIKDGKIVKANQE
ncbi:MAG: amidohydrolase family protein [Euryarchaeota archaeon]|nr:amidohydrolase family protein [Euryarchaeota archaeon]MBU4547428.1 amidohydrolase family protein [Euryarchaeota archaeon]MBU4607191.1 amidohydrolase family protein [Euryarchaeota archaeon]MBV1728824.1 amidohydrolase family protein [Methanobacterium sp.]MBV1755221.1 amidohydrolase family protein [Methanobacterium sp.]